MCAALNYLSEINTLGRKVFICGDMLELGEESLNYTGKSVR